MTATSERAPDGPTDLPRQGWQGTLKRTVAEFRDDNLTDWAAALTYYAVQALFPAVLVLVALLGLLGNSNTINDLLGIVGKVGSKSTVDAIKPAIEGVINSKGGAGALLGVGLLGSLWSASGYVGAFMRAANAVYEKQEGRPFWKLRPLQILVTLVMTLLLAIIAISITLTGSLAKAVGDVIGVGSTAVTVWNIAKWPVLLLIVVGMVAILYYVAPNVRQPKFRWISPGGLLAVLLWGVASAAFGFYVANFGSYNKTYGTIGGIISLLVWLWISNLALLFGIEFNSELERARELEAGLPAEDEIQLEPRQAPKGEADDG
ncbi:MAG: rane protein [Solirubrobacteraceae bacterium]|jgi:membrane protein|nr:rane protein [Solirubrobacteraceae bacterium]